MKTIAFNKLVAIVLIALLMTSCVNVYKKGVEYPDFPEKDIPIYDDAVVFEYEGDEDESEITYGTTDDIDDIIEFYQDEFDDEDYVIVEEEQAKDEYKVEGYVDDIHFEIEVEEASKEEEEYFEYIVNISSDYVDDKEVEEARAALYSELVIVTGYDGEVAVGCFNLIDDGKPIRVYLDGDYFDEGNGVQIDGSMLTDAPHDLLVEVLDTETDKVVSKQLISKLMYYDASDDGALMYMSEAYKAAESLVIDFEYDETDLSALSQFTNLKYLTLLECGGYVDLSPIASNKTLAFLAIGDGDANLNNLESLSSLTKLETLILNGGFENIDFVSSFNKLTTLILESGCSDISPIANLSKLRTLYFTTGSYEMDDISALQNLKNLEQLEISGYFEDISYVENLVKLKYLAMEGEFYDIYYVSGLAELEYLALSGNFMDISALASLTNLKEVYLDGAADVELDSTILDEMGVEYTLD